MNGNQTCNHEPSNQRAYQREVKILSKQTNDVEKINYILATDCGSTTSKARLFGKKNGQYRYLTSGEAPTTVEAPYENVTLGVSNAVREIEELTGRKLLSENGIITPAQGNEGVDLYVTTSSAGGGLQMMVAGVVRTMTAESAERAALGAGAIVMDVLSYHDERPVYEKIQRIRELRPDMIMIAGGVDGGSVSHVSEITELIAAAEPKARLGIGYELPVIYAGNVDVREHVSKVLGKKFVLKIVDNVRSELEAERVGPARDAVHELFMEHVMSHAPGYDKLMKWTPVPIMPTPAAEGTMFRTLAEMRNLNVIGVGLGGATTNVYSVYDTKFVRTVSANLGMSYSICNVMKQAGLPNILRWIPFDMNEDELCDTLRNKMIRPTTIPETLEELLVEHAVAREAIRLGFEHHKSHARSLRGVQRKRGVADVFDQGMGLESYINMKRINMIAGTGGLLSHAPRRVQAAMILIDAFQPEGVTRLAQDSVFMMPHLGVLSTIHKAAALEIFELDCLVRIGTCIAAKIEKDTEKLAQIDITMPDGKTRTEEILRGEIRVIPIPSGEEVEINIEPSKACDFGEGPGREVHTKTEGGEVGLILDGRGRPVVLPEDSGERAMMLLKWFTALNAYPAGSDKGGSQ